MADSRVDVHLSRRFVAGDLHFAVACSHLDDLHVVDALFADLATAGPAGEALELFTIQRVDGESSWMVSGPRLVQGQRLGTLSETLTTLMAAVNISALDAQPQMLHLHAAAATRPDGRTVVIAASRNSGKTTTIARLVDLGWSFVTDETVALEPHSRVIRGFPKPLSVKPGGLKLLPHLGDVGLPRDATGDEGFVFVPMGRTGASIASSGRPALVVLLRATDVTGQPHSDPVVRDLHPADAVVLLMQETLDADRFGSDSVAVLLDLAAASHCVEVIRGTPNATAQCIDELASSEPAAPMSVEENSLSDRLHPGVRSFRVGERSVVYHCESGRVLALDEPATAVWEHLAGWRPRRDIDLNGPVIRPFVAQLRDLNLLRSEQ